MLLCGEMIDIKLFGKILVIKKAWGMLNETTYISYFMRQNLISCAYPHLNHKLIINKFNGGLYGE